MKKPPYFYEGTSELGLSLKPATTLIVYSMLIMRYKRGLYLLLHHKLRHLLPSVKIFTRFGPPLKARNRKCCIIKRQKYAQVGKNEPRVINKHKCLIDPQATASCLLLTGHTFEFTRLDSNYCAPKCWAGQGALSTVHEWIASIWINTAVLLPTVIRHNSPINLSFIDWTQIIIKN